jgi:hypothetical protein
MEFEINISGSEGPAQLDSFEGPRSSDRTVHRKQSTREGFRDVTGKHLSYRILSKVMRWPRHVKEHSMRVDLE